MFSELTMRQKEIVLLIAEGYTNKEIAEKLYLSVPTIKNHVTAINKKWGGTNQHNPRALIIKNVIERRVFKKYQNRIQDQVREFEQALSDKGIRLQKDVPDIPVVLSREETYLRISLHGEEFDELTEKMIDLYNSDLNYSLFPYIMKEICDLIYVLAGTTIAMGIELQPIFDIVHKSNMSKIRTGTVRADGKLEKPEDFPDPVEEIRKHIIGQMNTPM